MSFNNGVPHLWDPRAPGRLSSASTHTKAPPGQLTWTDQSRCGGQPRLGDILTNSAHLYLGPV